jgi:hypothetical protein
MISSPPAIAEALRRGIDDVCRPEVTVKIAQCCARKASSLVE